MSLAIDNGLAVLLFHAARNYPPISAELERTMRARIGETNLSASLVE